MHIPKFLKMLMCHKAHTCCGGEGGGCKALMDRLQGKQGDIVADSLKVTGSSVCQVWHGLDTTRHPSICDVQYRRRDGGRAADHQFRTSNQNHYRRKTNMPLHSIPKDGPRALVMMNGTVPLIFPETRHTISLSSVDPLILPHSPLSPCLFHSLPSSPPDVRQSGRLCAAGCCLTLFKTMVTSCRLVLQPNTHTHTDAYTHTQRIFSHAEYCMIIQRCIYNCTSAHSNGSCPAQASRPVEAGIKPSTFLLSGYPHYLLLRVGSIVYFYRLNGWKPKKKKLCSNFYSCQC